MHTARINRIDTDAAGRYAVTASNDKTARVWDIGSGRLLQVLRPPIGPGNEGELYAVAMSPDGSTVAVGGWTKLGLSGGHTIYLFDRASGQLRRSLSGLPDVAHHLSFSPDGRWLAATLGGPNGVRVWDWKRSTLAQADSGYGKASYGASWSTDGRLATTSFDGKLRLYRPGEDGRLAKLAEAVAPGGARPFALAFHPDGSRIAIGYDDTLQIEHVQVVDGKRLLPLYSPSSRGVDNGDLGSVAWSRDGRTLVAVGRWFRGGKHFARLWPEAGHGKPRDVPLTHDTAMDLATLPAGGWLVAAADPAWGQLSTKGDWHPLGRQPIADLRGSVNDAFLLADAGRRLQFGYEPLGKSPYQFDLAHRALSAGLLPGGQAPINLAFPDWKKEYPISPTPRGQSERVQEEYSLRSLAAMPGGEGPVIGTDWSLLRGPADGRLRWQQQVPGVAWGVNIPTDGPQAGQIVVAAYGDGTIRWHRLSDGAELLAFFPHADRQRWVLWTPSGYYDASPGGEELIGWHVNRDLNAVADFYPASRFRNKYYRPDVIDRVLDTLDETEALKRADLVANRRNEPSTPVTQLLPPTVDLLSGSEFSTAAPQLSLRVRGRTAADAPVTAWRVRVNGLLVASLAGADASGRIVPVAGGGDQTLQVPLPPQDSEIQVFAESRNGTSSPALVRVKWAGDQAATAGAYKRAPKLYVLAVGVGAYAHAQIGKLNFPAKDARDFANVMRAQQGRLYREVEVRLLQDGQATRDEVVDGLDWLQKQVTQHDIAMLFIAGHGINDPTQGYTFLPFNADPERLKRTGVSMAEVRNTLNSLAGKALFFFDTCHAGNVLGEGRRTLPNDVSGVINELASAENGVVVFSSSTGRQFSYEDPKWGNGAFTKALVQGLGGAAAQPGSSRITHKMLDYYISDEVKRLTGGKQTPVTQAPGGVPDFPVAVKE